jgi:hypothetical protein
MSFGCRLLICFAIATAASVARAETIIASFTNDNFLSVTDAPFYLDFTLVGTAGNSVSVTNFNFGVGHADPGTTVATGDATGSLSSGLYLADGPSSFYNDIYQEYVPGTSLSFRINMTNTDASTPDTLAISLLDATLNPVPTLDPSGANTLITVDLGSTPVFSSYAVDVSQSTRTMEYPNVPAATYTIVAAAAPEPSTVWYALSGLAAFLAFARKRVAGALLCVAFALTAHAQTCQPLYQPAGSPLNVVSGQETTGTALADFDGDGHPDMAVLTFGSAPASPQLFLYRGNGAGGFSAFSQSVVTLPGTLMNGGNGIGVYSGDFNHDGKVDLLVASNKGALVILTGLGNGSFTLPSSPAYTFSTYSGSSPFQVVVTDLNGDGYSDVVVSFGRVGILLNSQGTLGTPSGLGTETYAFAGDVNGDGYPDLVGISGEVYLNNTHGAFTGMSGGIVYPSGSGNSFNGAVADFNGDGKADFLFEAVTADGSSIEYELFPGDGTGHFTSNPVVVTGVAASPFLNSSIAVGDFNGDGKLDFAFSATGNKGTQTAALSVFVNTGNNGFANLTGSPFTLGYNATSAQVFALDLNGDGRSDLVATSVSASPASSGYGEAFVFLSNAAVATVGVTTNANPGVAGASLTLTAVVGGAACSRPTGVVTFSIDGGAPQTASLVNGLASYTLAAGLTTGIHSIVATYSGDANFASVAGAYVQFIGASTCSPNLTGQVTVKPGGFVFDRTHQQFVQTVSITNNGPTLTGPVTLALDSLSSGVTLATASGYTGCALPAGSPLADLGICPGNPLAQGGTATVILRFNDPTMKAITYTPRVLAGLSVR